MTRPQTNFSWMGKHRPTRWYGYDVDVTGGQHTKPPGRCMEAPSGCLDGCQHLKPAAEAAAAVAEALGQRLSLVEGLQQLRTNGHSIDPVGEQVCFTIRATGCHVETTWDDPGFRSGRPQLERALAPWRAVKTPGAFDAGWRTWHYGWRARFFGPADRREPVRFPADYPGEWQRARDRYLADLGQHPEQYDLRGQGPATILGRLVDGSTEFIPTEVVKRAAGDHVLNVAAGSVTVVGWPLFPKPKPT